MAEESKASEETESKEEKKKDAEPEAPFVTPADVKVAPLKCTNCGSPVPVGADDIDVVACRACKTECKVPADVSRLRKAASSEAKARDEAQKLSDELNAEPTVFRKFWSFASIIAFIALFITLVIWFGIAIVMCIPMLWDAGLTAALVTLALGCLVSIPLVYNEILHDLAPSFGIDLTDSASDGGAYAIMGLSFYLLLTLPIILGAYADGFDGARDLLRGILAAKPPRTEGGPAECRYCGGALDVKPGTTHVRCIYCSTDNLVDVPKDLSEKAAKDAKSKHRDVASAHKEAKENRTTGMKLALNRSWKWLIGVVIFFMLLGRIVAAVNRDGPLFFTRAVPGAAPVPNNSKNALPPEGQRGEFTVHTTFDHCGNKCEAYFYVPLEKGETVRFRTEGPIEGFIEQREIGKWYNPSYTWLEFDDSKGAPYQGWYRMKLEKPERSKGAVYVTWKRVPPGTRL